MIPNSLKNTKIQLKPHGDRIRAKVIIRLKQLGCGSSFGEPMGNSWGVQVCECGSMIFESNDVIGTAFFNDTEKAELTVDDLFLM